MITEFEEHCQGSAKVQFTVSRKSLPNLLEWSERLQNRFEVTIEIQWELDPEAGNVGDTSLFRWVAVSGKAENCKKAKNYITIFCDSLHHMYVTYPDGIHTELKELQAKLEETYSSVLQFLEVGKLLAKSEDELNLSLVVSVVEEITSRFQKRNMGRSYQPSEWSGSGGLRRHIEQSPPLYLPEDDLDIDSIVEDDTEEESASQMSETSTAVLRTPSKMYDPKDLLGGGPLMLRGKGDSIIAGQVIDLISPESSQKGYSISPDRKKIKSQPHGKGSQGAQSAVSKAYVKDSSDISLFTLSLNSQQKLAVSRILQRGEYTQFEIDNILKRIGSNWQCSELITMLHTQRRQRSVPQAPSRHETTSSVKLEKLKTTQESLMQSLLENLTPDPITQGSSSEFWPKRFSTPAPQTGNNHSGIDDMDSVIMLNDTDSVIIIPSDSESEIVTADSIEESCTYEIFYKDGVPEEKTKQPGSRPLQFGAKQEPGHHGRTAADKQQTAELQGVVESLRQQLKYLQDKMEREKDEVSSQQQVVTLLQQTQQEEMQRQYEEQKKRLLEQQQQFQKQFEMQEQELKVQQEIVLKELKQQQAGAVPDNPSEAIVIAPARKNLASPFRPVVIDGSNVAMAHGRGKVFSCCGIAICIQYFQKRGHQDITVFVPLGRRTQNPNNIDRPVKDQKILDQLEKQGLLSFTPSRRIGNNYVNCYDDRFIVRLAVENDGVIVSNDNYRDLMGESPQWKYVVENRLVMYTFAGDRFMIPDDPLGRSGPRIDQILRKAQHPGIATNLTSHPRLASLRRGPTGSSSGQLPLTQHLMAVQAPMPVAIPWGPGASAGAGLVRQVQAPMPVAIPWGPGASAGAGLVRQVAPTAQQKPSPFIVKPAKPGMAKPGMAKPGMAKPGMAKPAVAKPAVAKPAVAKPAVAKPAMAKPAMAPTFGKIPGRVQRDLRQHPSFETLMTIFPDNEKEVLNVLTQHSDKTDSNELVILVLVEKEKSETL